VLALSESHFYNNSATVAGGAIATTNDQMAVNNNCMGSGNSAPQGAIVQGSTDLGAPLADFELNWWGAPEGAQPGDVSGAVDFEPFLTVAPAYCILLTPLQ
ncbi:MAG: hypothetical protein H7Y11_11320, partial [Armatimonadetes bacterium]|nr:hypothetical protein [Anaerolineae bacterium]